MIAMFATPAELGIAMGLMALLGFTTGAILGKRERRSE